MTDPINDKMLREELEQFKKDKEKIRKFIGSIGGQGTSRWTMVINAIFCSIIVVLFAVAFIENIMQITIPVMSPLFSIEVGILLVSIKIIWMIHKQTKVEHFQFWILNSIEFRVNDISKKIYDLEQTLEKKEKANK